jgi:hypothetical protein
MLRFAIIEEVEGYKRHATTIKVNRTSGEVKVSGKNAKELAPTEDEQKAITKAILAKAKMIPRSFVAYNLDGLEKHVALRAVPLLG